MKHILILGSEGFIGSHLINYYLSQSCNVYGCDLFETSSSDYPYFKISRLSPEWDELFSRYSFDACINAAGSGNVPYSMTHPVSDFEANTLDAIRMLDTLRRNGASCRYVHISSAAVYGNPKQLPVREEDDKKPLSPYGWHKLMSEQICLEYSQLYNLPTAVVRPFSVYGPGLKKQLFWDIYQKCRSNTDRLEMWGSGNESRDFIYISDLVNCLNLIIQHAPMQGEVYNAASGREISIKEASETFISFLEKKPTIFFNGNVRKGDPLNWRADITRIQSLGFKPLVNFSEGLTAYAQWLMT